jgi:hypothetical protein
MQKSLIIFMALILMTAEAMSIDYTKKMKNEKNEELKIPKIIDFPYARDYISVGKGNWSESIEMIVKNDPLFVQGNNMLNKPEMFVQKNVFASNDPESGDKTMKTINVADIENAVKKLAESAVTKQNPVSAYEAMMLSLKVYGKGEMNPIKKDMQIISKLLYLNEVCEGYVLYGEILEGSGNQAMAYDVYTKGMESKKCTGWYQSVIGGRLSMIKKSVNK